MKKNAENCDHETMRQERHGETERDVRRERREIERERERERGKMA